MKNIAAPRIILPLPATACSVTLGRASLGRYARRSALTLAIAGISGGCAHESTAPDARSTEKGSPPRAAVVGFKGCVEREKTPVAGRCTTGTMLDVTIVDHLDERYRFDRLCVDTDGYASTGEIGARDLREINLRIPEPCDARPLTVVVMLKGTGIAKGYKFEVKSSHAFYRGVTALKVELISDPHEAVVRAPAMHWDERTGTSMRVPP